MKQEDVIKAINRLFRGRWFRATELVACLEYSSKIETQFSEILNMLYKMVEEGKLEIDHTHSWFRLRNEAL